MTDEDAGDLEGRKKKEERVRGRGAATGALVQGLVTQARVVARSWMRREAG